MNMHELRHGVPADLTRTDGSGFYLPPADETRVPVGSADDQMFGVLCAQVRLAIAQPPHGHARTVANQAIAHTLALYGQHDHEEAVERVARVLPGYSAEGDDIGNDAIIATAEMLIDEAGEAAVVPTAPPWHDMRTAEEAGA